MRIANDIFRPNDSLLAGTLSFITPAKLIIIPQWVSCEFLWSLTMCVYKKVTAFVHIYLWQGIFCRTCIPGLWPPRHPIVGKFEVWWAQCILWQCCFALVKKSNRITAIAKKSWKSRFYGYRKTMFILTALSLSLDDSKRHRWAVLKYFVHKYST